MKLETLATLALLLTVGLANPTQAAIPEAESLFNAAPCLDCTLKGVEANDRQKQTAQQQDLERQQEAQRLEREHEAQRRRNRPDSQTDQDREAVQRDRSETAQPDREQQEARQQDRERRQEAQRLEREHEQDLQQRRDREEEARRDWEREHDSRWSREYNDARGDWERQESQLEWGREHDSQGDWGRDRDGSPWNGWQDDPYSSRGTTRIHMTSLTNDWVTVSIEGVNGGREFSFTGSNPEREIELLPGAYRVRLRSTLSSDPWQSGYLNVGQSDSIRIVFDQDQNLVQVYDHPDAWMPEGYFPNYRDR